MWGCNTHCEYNELNDKIIKDLDDLFKEIIIENLSRQVIIEKIVRIRKKY